METSSHIPVFLSLQSNLTLALVCFILFLRSSETLQNSDRQQPMPKMHYILFHFLFLFLCIEGNHKVIKGNLNNESKGNFSVI